MESLNQVDAAGTRLFASGTRIRYDKVHLLSKQRETAKAIGVRLGSRATGRDVGMSHVAAKVNENVTTALP